MDHPFVDVFDEAFQVGLDGDAVASRVAARHGVTVAELKAHGRKPRVVEARRDLFRELREIGWTYVQIGAFVGGRDHTTVMFALGLAHKERRRAHG